MEEIEEHNYSNDYTAVKNNLACITLNREVAGDTIAVTNHSPVL
jgi:hypothetical protein